MFANFQKQSILKHMLLLAGIGAGAFWLGSRVVSVHDSAAVPHSVESAHLVASAPEIGRPAAKERSFAPPRIEASEADASPTPPDPLLMKTDTDAGVKPTEATAHPQPTVGKRIHKRRRHRSIKPVENGHDVVRHDDVYDNNDNRDNKGSKDRGDGSGPDVNGEPAGGYGDKGDGKND